MPPRSPYEVRLRVAARAPTAELAAIVGEEVEALYTNGPAGGGGARKYVQRADRHRLDADRSRARAAREVTLREWTPHAETV